MFSFSSTDLWISLARIGIALAILLAVIGIIVWWGRRRGSTTLTLDVTLTLSAWWVALSTLGLITAVVQAPTADFTELGGSLPAPWPVELPCVEHSGNTAPALACTRGEVSNLMTYNSGLTVRLLAGFGQATNIALQAIPALVIAVLCFQTLRRLPFTRTVTRTLLWAAAATLMLGILNDLMPEITRGLALREIFPNDTMWRTSDNTWYPMSFNLSVTPWPFAAALALVALAAVFRRGIALQREYEDLQKDTEGLV